MGVYTVLCKCMYSVGAILSRSSLRGFGRFTGWGLALEDRQKPLVHRFHLEYQLVTWNVRGLPYGLYCVAEFEIDG